MQQLDVIMGSGAAMLMGGAIGFERELRDRPAGFRTHMLVAGAAALLVGLGVLVLGNHAALADGDGGRLRVDPLRLVEAVIAGVAFIGAGSIFARRRGSGVAGITTAASLLMVSVIGIACGFGYYLLAFLAMLLTLVVLTLLKFADRALARRRGDAAPGG